MTDDISPELEGGARRAHRIQVGSGGGYGDPLPFFRTGLSGLKRPRRPVSRESGKVRYWLGEGEMSLLFVSPYRRMANRARQSVFSK
jgi:hypothetical protein